MFNEMGAKGQLKIAPSIKEISDERVSKTVYFSVPDNDMLLMFN